MPVAAAVHGSGLARHNRKTQADATMGEASGGASVLTLTWHPRAVKKKAQGREAYRTWPSRWSGAPTTSTNCFRILAVRPQTVWPSCS